MKLHTLLNGQQVAVIETDTHISKWVIQSDRLDHDQNMLPLLDPYIHKGFTVVDIGAYIGDHTEYYVKRVGRLGKVFAFEPNPIAFECLHYNMNKHHNVATWQLGISDAAHGISLLADPNAGATHAIEGNDIQCITLDSLELPECHFIKMDCEGMELRALEGSKNTIAKHSPVMLLEINQGALVRQGFDSSDVFNWLIDNGYCYRNIYKEQGLTDAQFDILCEPL